MYNHFKFNREFRNMIILYGFALIFWLSLVFYREFNNTDIVLLRKNIMSICNGWCFGHFIHYMLLGYFAPSYWKYIIIIGIVFELIEILLNKASKYIDSKLIEDSITNTLGLFTGLILHNFFPNKIDILQIMKN